MNDRLELGSGHRPTPGYLTSDINAFDGIDFVCSPEKIGLPDGSLIEVLALGVIEHLTFRQVDEAFINIHRLLKSGGEFVFDVPDLKIWCDYYMRSQNGEKVPVDRDHILGTLFGHQRWPGDEHKSGFSKTTIDTALRRPGFSHIEYGVELMRERGHHRNRMDRPEDAHIYVVATKT